MIARMMHPRVAPLKLALAMGAAGLASGLAACSTEDLDLWTAAMTAEANCPYCTTEQKVQLAQQYRDTQNPYAAVERRDAELAADRTTYSDPDTYRCRYEDGDRRWTEDVRVEFGEWYFGPPGNPNQAGDCNSARLNNSGARVEVRCALRPGMIQRSVSIFASYGNSLVITTINTLTGRAVLSMTGLGSDGSSREIIGRCQPTDRAN